MEHLDFLNDSICSAMEWHSVAVHEYKNSSEIGHYKSLTDVSKAPIVVEDIDYNNHVCSSTKRSHGSQQDNFDLLLGISKST